MLILSTLIVVVTESLILIFLIDSILLSCSPVA